MRQLLTPPKTQKLHTRQNIVIVFPPTINHIFSLKTKKLNTNLTKSLSRIILGGLDKEKPKEKNKKTLDKI